MGISSSFQAAKTKALANRPPPAVAPAPAGVPGPTGPYNEVLSGYSDFAKTGGFTPENLANIRARAVSPVRANYANALQDVDRQRAIQGGYSPGYGVLRARMQREQGQGISDAATGAESNIAQMVQEGKLAGLGGLSGLIDRGGGGGGGADTTPVPEKKKSVWQKIGGALKKIGQVALPIAMSVIPGGSLLGAGLGKVGLGAATTAGAASKIGKGGIPGIPMVKP